jgi:HK97 gp10 family phage protein
MASKVSFKVEGLQELEQQLLKLDASTGRKILKGALNAATKPIIKKAKEDAPERTGRLKKAIFRTSSRVGGVPYLTGDAAAQVTIGIKRFGKAGAPHAYIQEYGSKQRFRRKSRRERRETSDSNLFVPTGRVKGRFFMNNAWKKHGNMPAINIFKKTLQRRIKRAMK